jgi:hypothetical protein
MTRDLRFLGLAGGGEGVSARRLGWQGVSARRVGGSALCCRGCTRLVWPGGAHVSSSSALDAAAELPLVRGLRTCAHLASDRRFVTRGDVSGVASASSSEGGVSALATSRRECLCIVVLLSEPLGRPGFRFCTFSAISSSTGGKLASAIYNIGFSIVTWPVQLKHKTYLVTAERRNFAVVVSNLER